jgi:hypothetical protein
MSNTVVYTIPSYFLNYLVNGDVEGLTPEELGKIIKFERQLSEQSKGSIAYDFSDTEPYFASYNDIDNIGGDVVDLKVNYIG